jgi:hypothetical protein
MTRKKRKRKKGVQMSDLLPQNMTGSRKEQCSPLRNKNRDWSADFMISKTDNAASMLQSVFGNEFLPE